MKAVQEQQKLIDSLFNILNPPTSTQRKTNTGEQNTGHSETISHIQLSSNNELVLFQNEPNPFEGSTTIRYFIPENLNGEIVMVFYDMFGKELNKLEIKQKGFGKIEIDSKNLADGIYSYSLLVSGVPSETKKMIRSK